MSAIISYKLRDILSDPDKRKEFQALMALLHDSGGNSIVGVIGGVQYTITLS